MLQIDTQAPDFTLPDADGNMVSLQSFRGKKVVVYFYPKDNTPGCTKQACAFRDSFGEFQKRGIVVIGISKDSQKSHKKFVGDFTLPFILLSDPELTAIKAYDVWQEKSLYGRKYLGVARSTFVIDETGKIIKVFEKAKPDTNAREILESLG